MKHALKKLFPITFVLLLVITILVPEVFASNDETSIQTAITLCSVAKFLKGAGGWLIIGFGLILALWDYFIQKQGHLIIVAIVGILIVIIIGRILASKATEGNGSLINSTYVCEEKCQTGKCQ